MYEFSPDTRVGVNYRSEVDLDLSGNPEFSNIDNVYLVALNDLGLLGQEIVVDFTVPQQLQLGVFHQLNDRYSVTADIIWLDMSEFAVTSVSAKGARGLMSPARAWRAASVSSPRPQRICNTGSRTSRR